MSTIKKKRVSKKKKIAWRKHVNIKDVEEFLEDKRLEERLGPPLETLSNESIFKIDTDPSKEPKLSIRERKKLKLLQPRSFSVLQPSSKVPDPIAKRNRVRTPEERKNTLVKKREQENREKGILKYTEVQSLRDRKIHQQKKAEIPKKGDFNLDIWNKEEKFNINLGEWATTNTKRHNLAGVGKLQKRVVKPVQKDNVVPAVEAPHPGTSYNPSFEDHQKLLKEIAEKEIKIIKNEEHLNRVTKSMFSKVTHEERDNAWLTEYLKSKEEDDADASSDNEYKSINPPVENKKKTLKQRRKQKEQMLEEQKRKAAKLEKRKVADIHRLQMLNRIIEKQNKKLEELREKRKKAAELKKKETKRLGPLKFEEADVEFNFGQDIAGNLRNVKKEGNLLLDRFKSLQKRSILEPTTKRLPKRAKVKRYTKPGHKDNWKETVAKSFK